MAFGFICLNSQEYWLLWNRDGTLRIGTGSDIGRSELYRFANLNKVSRVNAVAMRTGTGTEGTWVFYESGRE